MTLFTGDKGKITLITSLAIAVGLRNTSLEMIKGLSISLGLFTILYSYYKRKGDFLSCILIVAFALRFFIALLTEFYPLFPEKYYSDGLVYHADAIKIAKAWASFDFFSAPVTFGAFGTLNYSRFIAIFHLIFGSSLFLPKVINSFVSAISLIPAHKIAERFGGQKGAKMASTLFAFWDDVPVSC